MLSEKIYIVDPKESFDEEYFSLLKNGKNTVDIFSNFKDFSIKVQTEFPKICIFNCEDFQTIEFTKYLRLLPETYFLVMCDKIDEKECDNLLELGQIEVIVKPVTAKQLNVAVKNTISNFSKLNDWKLDSLKYNLLFELGTEAILVVDQESLLIIDANDLALSHYGTIRGEIINKKITDFSAEPETTFKAVKNASQDYKVAIRYQKRKDGSIFPIEAQVKVLTFQGKRLLFVAFRDITEKINFEEKMLFTTECFLEFGTNIEKNINLLTVLAGRVLKSKSANYLRKLDTAEVIIGRYNLPESSNIFTLPYKKYIDDTLNLSEIEDSYSKIIDNQGIMYLGIPVRESTNKKHGILSLVFEKHRVLNYEDMNILKVIAGVIGIEERRRTSEEGLNYSENKFKSYVESSPYGIFICDRLGEYLDVNDTACKILGYTKKELLTLNVRQIIPEKYQSVGLEVFQLMIARDKVSSQIVLQRKDNSIFNASIETAKIEDNRYIGFVKDISEEIKIESELSKSKNYSSFIFNLIPEAIFVQTNNRIVAINEAGVELYGGKCEKDFIGLSIFKLFHTNYYDIISDRIERMLRNGKKVEPYEEIHLTLKGEEIIVEVTAAPVEYEGKLSIVVVSRNIKERKLAEEVKRKSISELKLLSDFAITLNIINDIDKIRELLIDKLKNLCPNSEVISIPFYSSVNGTHADKIFSTGKKKSKLREFLEQKTYNFDGFEIINNRVFNGKIIEVQPDLFTEITPFSDLLSDIKKASGFNSLSMIGFEYNSWQNGDVIFISHSSETVINSSMIETLANQASVAINRKNFEEKLQHTLNEKEALIKEIHHRVKNNLQIISSLLNLQIDYVNDEDTKILLTESLNRIRSMALIHERLYQSKNLAKINFAEYVVDLCNYLLRAYKIGELDVTFSFKIEAKYLTMDSIIPIGLIINELVSNSLKYAFVGKSTGKIGIEFKHCEGQKYLLAIDDDGVGLKENYNIKETKTLGMLLVNNLVEQIDGEITVISKKGLKYSIIFRLED